VIRRQLQELVQAEPFEPFRLKLVNGDFFDVCKPLGVAVQTKTVLLALGDQNWVVFPLDKLNSIESLISENHGQSTAAGEP
jgi:hypothetical protein